MHLALRQRFRSLPSRFLNSFSASFRQPRALARKHKSLRCSCCTFARPSPSEQHQPVLLAEVLTVFADVSLSTFVDGTVGAGGHSSAIAHAHAELSQLVGLDVDPRALQLASARLTACNSKAKVVLENSNFSALQRVLQSALGGGVSVDGILLDIGVSSMQLDTSERGFSFSRDGPLDMRMGPSAKLSAADIVNAQPEAELGRIFREFGEERQWRRFARNICEARATQALHTTAQLLKAMRVPSTPSYSKGRKQIHPATRVFQALRIAVNDELGVLEAVLPQAIQCLAPGGRLAVISFHSLEDRIVKRAFLAAAGRNLSQDKHLDNWNLPDILQEETALLQAPSVKILTKKPLQATAAEASINPRSRSAKLRAVQKL